MSRGPMGSIGALRPVLLRAESRNRRAVLRPAAAQPLVAGVSRPGLLSRGGAAYAAQTPRWYPTDPSPLQRHHAPAVGILLAGYLNNLMGLGRCPILSLVRRQALPCGNPGSRQRRGFPGFAWSFLMAHGGFRSGQGITRPLQECVSSACLLGLLEVDMEAIGRLL